MDKDISVVIPAYNAARTVERAINSVLDFDAALQWEIIVVNDGSTDETQAVVEKLEQSHANILLINQKNKGRSEARNTGVSFATARWVMFLDSDDVLLNSGAPSLVSATRDTSAQLHVFPMLVSDDGVTSEALRDSCAALSFEVSAREIVESMVTAAGFPRTVTLTGTFFEVNSSCARLYQRSFLQSLVDSGLSGFGPFPRGVRFSEDRLFNIAYLTLPDVSRVLFWPSSPIYCWDLGESSTVGKVNPEDGADIPLFATRSFELVDGGKVTVKTADKLVLREILTKLLRAGSLTGVELTREAISTWRSVALDSCIMHCLERCRGNVVLIGYKRRFQPMMNALVRGDAETAFLWARLWATLHKWADFFKCNLRGSSDVN